MSIDDGASPFAAGVAIVKSDEGGMPGGASSGDEGRVWLELCKESVCGAMCKKKKNQSPR